MFLRDIKKRTVERIYFAALGLLAVGAALMAGCASGITGNEYVNTPPKVRFVNVPPDGTIFSANPTISWVGSDIDGQIVQFRYVVALEDDIIAAVGSPVTPQMAVQYAQSLPDSAWIRVNVSLDSTGTTDTVRLAADFDNPVRNIVQQYVFLMAIDDKNSRSEIVFRVFGRNDHFPDTRVVPFLSPYVNLQAERAAAGISGGVRAVWAGDDQIDFPNVDNPPLEFQWKLFGPYSSAESTMIMSNFRKTLFVSTEQTYEIGDTFVDTAYDFTKADTTIDSMVNPPDTTISVHIDSIVTLAVQLSNSVLLNTFGSFDTIIVLDSLTNLDQVAFPGAGITRQITSSFNPLTGDSWVTNGSETFIDIYRNDPLVTPGGPGDTTRERTFLFWVQARDDAFVPDPTPAFGTFNAIEPKHERDVLIIDYARTDFNGDVNGAYMPPCMIPTNASHRDTGTEISKYTYANFIEGWYNGFVGPDNSAGYDTGSFDPCGVDNGFVVPGENCNGSKYQTFKSSPDYLLGTGMFANSPFQPTLRDVLKHKVVLFVKEHVVSPLPFSSQSFGVRFLMEGVTSGINFWTMSRSPFIPNNFSQVEPQCFQVAVNGVPEVYAGVFGIQGGCFQAWYGMAVQRGESNHPLPNVRNEDFIGAVPNSILDPARFAELFVDPARMKESIRWSSKDAASLPGCPPAIINLQKDYRFMDSIAAVPEVGYVIPRPGTQTLYLYRSRFGEAKYPFWDLEVNDYQGTVVAVRRDAGFFRSSHWSFTPLSMDSATFQVSFSTMMDWLFAEPWGGPGFGSPRGNASHYDRMQVTPEANEYVSKIEALRQEQLNEILPPGQKTVKNQFEFEKYLKRWNAQQQALQMAESKQF